MFVCNEVNPSIADVYCVFIALIPFGLFFCVPNQEPLLFKIDSIWGAAFTDMRNRIQQGHTSHP